VEVAVAAEEVEDVAVVTDDDEAARASPVTAGRLEAAKTAATNTSKRLANARTLEPLRC
jgi:hypothetical protein